MRRSASHPSDETDLNHGFAPALDALRARRLGEVRRHRQAAVGFHGGDEVEVADRLAPAPQAACDFRAHDVRMRAQVGEESQRYGPRLAQQVALLKPSEVRQAFENSGLRLGAEAGELGDLAGAAGALEVGRRADAELLMQHTNALRPEAADAEEIEQPRRILAPELVVQRQASGVDDLGDRLHEPGADAGELRQTLLLQQVLGLLGESLERARRVLVGAHAEGVGALELEQRRGLLEDANEGVAAHRPLRHARASSRLSER
jgi:hypothetical protein